MGGEKTKTADAGSAPASRKTKTADAGSASASSKKKAAKKSPKAAGLKMTMEKRRKQYRHLRTLLQLSIRIINAFGRGGTIYRK